MAATTSTATMTPAAMPPALAPDLPDLAVAEAEAVGPFVMVEALAAEGS
jgi:hypothetical protein